MCQRIKQNPCNLCCVPIVIILAILIVFFEFRNVGDNISQTVMEEGSNNFTYPINETLNILAVNTFDTKALISKRNSVLGNGPAKFADYTEKDYNTLQLFVCDNSRFIYE